MNNKKYNTAGTFSKYNRQIVEGRKIDTSDTQKITYHGNSTKIQTENRRETKSIQITHIYMAAHFSGLVQALKRVSG